jgi:hypothetical protein
MRWWLIVVFCGALAGGIGASCGDGSQCECFPCGSAVTVSVVDPNFQPLGDWTLQATLDGQLVDTSECDPMARQGNNTCSFGDRTGVYQIVVRTASTEKEVAARFAERGGQDCCNCLAGEVVQVTLP